MTARSIRWLTGMSIAAGEIDNIRIGRRKAKEALKKIKREAKRGKAQTEIAVEERYERTTVGEIEKRGFEITKITRIGGGCTLSFIKVRWGKQ